MNGLYEYCLYSLKSLETFLAKNIIAVIIIRIDAFLIKIVLLKSKLLKNKQSGIKSINANK
jgi:hypothetical protein